MSKIINFPKRKLSPGKRVNDTIVFEEQVEGAEGCKYEYRATRNRIGAFDTIAIDFNHPNFGFFSEGILWILSPHMKDWEPHPVATPFQKYGTVKEFVKDWPQFKELFTFEGRYDPYGEIVEKVLSEGIEDL